VLELHSSLTYPERGRANEERPCDEAPAAISAAPAVVRLHLAEELECVAGLTLAATSAGFRPLATALLPSGTRIHQVVQPAAAAAKAPKDVTSPWSRSTPHLSARFRARAVVPEQAKCRFRHEPPLPMLAPWPPLCPARDSDLAGCRAIPARVLAEMGARQRSGGVPRWKDLVAPRSHQNFHHGLAVELAPDVRC